MIIDSSILRLCEKKGKNFKWTLDSSEETIILHWDWFTEHGGRRSYGHSITFKELERAVSVKAFIEQAADEGGWGIW